MKELTTQDKIQLNRRAKAHGLPALWPEAEEQLRTLDKFFENLTRSHARNMANLGMGMSAPWHGDPLSAYLAGCGLGAPVPPYGYWPSTAIGNYADPFSWPSLRPLPAPSPLSRLKSYFRHRVGLP